MSQGTTKGVSIDVDGTLAANSDSLVASQKAVRTYVAASTRELLTENRTYYIRSDGSDSNNGLANTSGGAWLTFSKAVAVVSALDRSIYDVTVNVGNATRTTGIAITGMGPGSGLIDFVGDATTPANCLISTTSATAISVTGRVSVRFSGFKVTAATSGYGVLVQSGALVQFNGAMDFGACATHQIGCFQGSQLDINADYTISGGSATHVNASSHSRINCPNRTVTITGPPAFSTAFANAQFNAFINTAGCTFSGSATGSRYNAANGGIINSGGVTLPGNAAGTGTNFGTSPYGLYI